LPRVDGERAKPAQTADGENALSQLLRVEQLVDEQSIGRFNVQLLIWSFLAMFADGYDLSAMPFAAPSLVHEWHLPADVFGPVFSASLIGILFGAPLMGWVGDRFGRRIAIIIGCILYGVSTLSMVLAHSLEQMIALRVITGIGLGGLMPNTIALSSELSPKRWRATLVVLMFTGITLGSGTPGPVAAWLVPLYGWQVLFILGGLVPLIVAACLPFVLPESIKFLVMHPERRPELLRTARSLRPELTIADDARFETASAARANINPLQIFRGGLAAITPLLWLCFVMVLMSNYFLNSWMPLLFQISGLSPKAAALTSSLYHVGGTLGGVLLSVLLDRFGFVAIAVLLVIAVPSIVLIGVPGTGIATLAVVSTIAGFGVLGGQFGNNASAGLLYPTAVRSTAVGCAFAIGRFGGIAGPIVGGLLLQRHWGMPDLFKAASVPMAIGAVAAIVLARLCYVRYGGLTLDDTPVATAPATGTAASIMK
jgi:AAHS family 4-hydroxybenzoate transporter-like MFS transporter